MVKVKKRKAAKSKALPVLAPGLYYIKGSDVGGDGYIYSKNSSGSVTQYNNAGTWDRVTSMTHDGSYLYLSSNGGLYQVDTSGGGSWLQNDSLATGLPRPIWVDDGFIYAVTRSQTLDGRKFGDIWRVGPTDFKNFVKIPVASDVRIDLFKVAVRHLDKIVSTNVP